MVDKVTTSAICAAMAKRWAAPEYALMWEVNEATGNQRGRAADAVIMSLWPSRGLELDGVEIKVSRSDYRREAANPAKAEAVAKYCDRWWLHVAPGVIDDLSAVPPAWGVRVFDGTSWKTLREAAKTEAAPISRPFLAALLRRADGVMAEMIEEAKRQGLAQITAAAREREESFAKRVSEDVERHVKRKMSELTRATENIAKFEAAFGENAALFGVNHSRLGTVARLLTFGTCESPPNMAHRLREAATLLDELSGVAHPKAGEGDQ